MILKILLLDSAFSAMPIHNYLLGLGHEVWTVGNRELDALAIAYPDRWLRGDYSDVTFVGDLVERHQFDRVVPGCTDVSMDVFVRLGLQPDYPYTLEKNQAINRKPLFRQLCAELNLPAPHCVSADAVPQNGRFICKPADSFSGRGVTIFDGSNPEAKIYALNMARQHSPTNEVVVEEFVVGELHSFTAFIESGRVATAFIVREGSRNDPFAVDTSYVRRDYNAEKMKTIQNAVEKLCERLQLCDGLLHTQFIDAGDHVAILEMTRRCPGDLYAMLISYSTGYNYAGYYAAYFIGARPSQSEPHTRHVLRHTIKQSGSPGFGGFELTDDQTNGLFSLIPVERLGQPLDPRNAMRTGIAFLEMPDADTLEERYHTIIGSKAREADVHENIVDPDFPM